MITETQLWILLTISLTINGVLATQLANHYYRNKENH